MDVPRPTTFRVGVTAAPAGMSREQVELHRLKVGKATSLKDLTEEYAFYTPALVYTRVRLLGRDPWWQFLQEYGKEVFPLTLRFDKPIFSGLHAMIYRTGRALAKSTSIANRPAVLDEAWNHVLYGMHKEHWDAYKAFMGTMAFVDRSLGLVTRIRYKDMDIADPLALSRVIVTPSATPLLPITVFCLDTNKGCTWIEPSVQPLVTLPSLQSSAMVFDDTRAFALAVLNDEANPYAAVDAAQPPELPQPAAIPDPVALEALPEQQQSAFRKAIEEYREQQRKKA